MGQKNKLGLGMTLALAYFCGLAMGTMGFVAIVDGASAGLKSLEFSKELLEPWTLAVLFMWIFMGGFIVVLWSKE